MYNNYNDQSEKCINTIDSLSNILIAAVNPDNLDIMNAYSLTTFLCALGCTASCFGNDYYMFLQITNKYNITQETIPFNNFLEAANLIDNYIKSITFDWSEYDSLENAFLRFHSQIKHKIEEFDLFMSSDLFTPDSYATTLTNMLETVKSLLLSLNNAKNKVQNNSNMLSTNRFSPNTINTESTISVADELKKYKGLLDCGAITFDEYNTIKSRLLGF